MTEKRGRGRDVDSEVVKEEEEEGFVDESMDEKPSTISASNLSESQLARIRLRERWELASVLNFLHVFKPVIRAEIEISAEEIETALITPNNVLAQLHIYLLKGIPPISKKLTESDAWVTEVCKKVALWWPWVAEGEIPVVVSHGEEIPRYKELDPIVRLVILKALCEVRAEQDDLLSYINDELKKGTQLSNFRKDMIAEDGNGTAYWYDGDSDIGYRLYREVKKVEFVPRVKGKGLGKGRLTQPINNFQWETLATNLEDFLQISKKLSSSENVVEAAVGKVVENEIIPVLEKLQKKKERALKRQQTQAMLLSGPLNPYKIVNTRSQRSRRPVSYTFDEYDRSISEAIQLHMKSTTRQDKRKHRRKDGEHGGRSGVSSNGSTAHNADDYKFRGGGEYEDDDIDYDGKNNNDNDSGGNSTSSEKENKTLGNETRQRAHSKKPKGRLPPRDVVGLRRSTRTTGHSSHPNLETRNHVDTKKMLRERLTPNTEPDAGVAPDSEDENSSGSTSNKTLGAEKNSLATLDGLLDESEEESDGDGLPQRN